MAASDDNGLIARLDDAIEELSTRVAIDRDACVPAEEEVAINHLIGLAVAEMLGDDAIRILADSGRSADPAGRPSVLARDLLISATLARRVFAH